MVLFATIGFSCREYKNHYYWILKTVAAVDVYFSTVSNVFIQETRTFKTNILHGHKDKTGLDYFHNNYVKFKIIPRILDVQNHIRSTLCYT